MKIAYIAGPYRADTQAGIKKNIANAAFFAAKYWRKGYAVICPHKNSGGFDNIVSDKSFLEGDKEFIKRLIPGTDIIVMLPNWEYSDGSCGEQELAKKLNIEVVYEAI